MGIIKDFWPLISAGIIFLVWIVRLESKTVGNKQMLENHQKTCLQRHKTENDHATKNNEDMKKAIDRLFDITIELGNFVHEFKGVLDGIKKH